MSDEMLTELEHSIVERLGGIANDLAVIMGMEQTRGNDFSEAIHHIHVLQHMVMGQAAARAYPSRYRLLGGLIQR